MDIKYYKLLNDSIIQVEKSFDSDNWSEHCDWINIIQNDRKELAKYFKQQNMPLDLIDAVEYPENHPLSNTFEKHVVLNIPISNTSNIYQADYLSVLYINNIIITINQEGNDFFNTQILSSYSAKKYASLENFLNYILILSILKQSNSNFNTARNRLRKLEEVFIHNVEDVSSKDLWSCEQDIHSLSDIIEDQYVCFEALVSLSYVAIESQDNFQLRGLIKGFEPLDKAMLRLENKAESLRLHYMLFQQEKSTKKINLLTIVQAVFVPLTFIAGVYGMNFINMPELHWRLGYLYVWFAFIALASLLLLYFYRKGWFD